MGSIEAEDHKSGIKKASTPKHKSVYTEASFMPSASYCDSICLDLKWAKIGKKCFIQSYGVIDNSNTVTISLFLTCWELCWFPQWDIHHHPTSLSACYSPAPITCQWAFQLGLCWSGQPLETVPDPTTASVPGERGRSAWRETGRQGGRAVRIDI